MATSFDIFYLGNLTEIDPIEGDQTVDTAAVNSWLGTYGGPGNALAGNAIQELQPTGTGFSGGQSEGYDLDNNVSNDQFLIDGVTKTHDATMAFNATITYTDGTTATITAVLFQTTDGDVYLAPETSNNTDQAALDALPLQSITLTSPIYANGTDQGFYLFADRFDADFIPCFTPGTAIATPRGEVPVEALKVGDKVFTRDNGIQVISWVGGRTLSASDLKKTPKYQPVMVRAGALGPNLPETDLLVSPNHRLLMTGRDNELYFDEQEVLAAAKHLVHLDGVDVVEAISGIQYIHIMFAQHEVILSNGAWTESFQPGDYSLRGVGQEQRKELFELFPELATVDGVEKYGAARTTLRRHEAKLLT
ncbi:MAG: hypothetical protein ACJAXK_002283 [Yoonia sp.]|jgi:hypothetical protein